MIRRGGPHDVPFLRDMLHHAYYWRENAPEMEDLPVSRYVLGWGRRGDASVVAIEDAWPVGAAWYRLFTEDEPGYGFVDEETPEFADRRRPQQTGARARLQAAEGADERARDEGFDAAEPERRAGQSLDRALREVRLPQGRRAKRHDDDGRRPERQADEILRRRSRPPGTITSRSGASAASATAGAIDVSLRRYPTLASARSRPLPDAPTTSASRPSVRRASRLPAAPRARRAASTDRPRERSARADARTDDDGSRVRAPQRGQRAPRLEGARLGVRKDDEDPVFRDRGEKNVCVTTSSSSLNVVVTGSGSIAGGGFWIPYAWATTEL